ncbi:FliO/MopB family protein [Roseospirillum parvum]|uniref:FliO/MopB family protein n=1 Tax=Roseospirillum parvum TaxID=83401 RepID=UPI0015A3907A|nr:flagellar biosynthetic protein FliO [Roseospirillum parvum]
MSDLSLADYAQFVGALMLVVGVILTGGALLRRYGPEALRGLTPGARGRRLKLVESLPVGARHRLVLVKRDDREHLLLLGTTDVVVERGIAPPGAEPAPGETTP